MKHCLRLIPLAMKFNGEHLCPFLLGLYLLVWRSSPSSFQMVKFQFMNEFTSLPIWFRNRGLKNFRAVIYVRKCNNICIELPISIRPLKVKDPLFSERQGPVHTDNIVSVESVLFNMQLRRIFNRTSSVCFISINNRRWTCPLSFKIRFDFKIYFFTFFTESRRRK